MVIGRRRRRLDTGSTASPRMERYIRTDFIRPRLLTRRVGSSLMMPSISRLARSLILILLAVGQALAQAPTPADAIALEQQGKLREAAQAWRAATERNPNDAGAFASLGVVLSKEQKYAEAAAAY